MSLDSAPRAVVTGYAHRPVTKAPNWHGLVAMDVLFNNLSSGLFLVAALSELVAPESFAALARVAYPIALLLLIADLVCLVLDLGDPFRFHHMLRVWKPSSPMSLGTWCLTAFALPLSVLSALSLLPGGGAGFESVRRLILIVGLVPALGTAGYKGVLFSTTAQPAWKDARWLGGYLINSALVLGAAGLLVLAVLLGKAEAEAVLRPALMLLLVLNLLALVLLLGDLRPSLRRAHSPLALTGLGTLVILAGLLLPMGLLALGGPRQVEGAVLGILLGAVFVRTEIVRLPHRLVSANV